MSDAPTPRAIFFDEDHALAVLARLRRDGFRATLAKLEEEWLELEMLREELEG